ncbi:MAG: hypothetical protein KF789_07490 [Bdellovibrionaceae bacterium]|nr:hypothetical protein [Pseudobdellovibrionaceae bacterium]
MTIAAEKTGLAQVSDAEILEEAAERLKRQYLNEHGVEFRFGSFHFIFHDGRFQAVEDWPRSRRYLSPKRVVGNKE